MPDPITERDDAIRAWAEKCAEAEARATAAEQEHDNYRGQVEALTAANEEVNVRLSNMRQERDTLREGLAQVRSILEHASGQNVDLRAMLAAAERREAELRRVGAQLANVAYNWSQPAHGTVHNPRDREMLDSLYRQWDALLSPSTPSPAPVPEEGSTP